MDCVGWSGWLPDKMCLTMIAETLDIHRQALDHHRYAGYARGKNLCLRPARLVGDKLLLTALEEVFNRIRMKLRIDEASPARWPQADAQHWHMCGALKKHDAEGAVGLLTKHLEQGKDRVIGIWGCVRTNSKVSR